MRGLRDKVAVITGAASGIGAATARRFADEGVRLVLGDIDEEGGEAVAAELRGRGGAATFRRCNVADIDAVTALVQGAVDLHGRLDVLFNNAGIGCYGKTPDLDPDLWRLVIEVDLSSVYYGCRAAIPRMIATAGGGAIVNTASTSGMRGDYGLAAYNAAKGGVVNYTRALALDHGPDGIRVNAVCPGPIATNLTAPLMSQDAVMEAYETTIPMGRVGEASEVAAVVAFLASDEASYVNGAVIPIDGGMTAQTGHLNLHHYVAGVV